MHASRSAPSWHVQNARRRALGTPTPTPTPASTTPRASLVPALRSEALEEAAEAAFAAFDGAGVDYLVHNAGALLCRAQLPASCLLACRCATALLRRCQAAAAAPACCVLCPAGHAGRCAAAARPARRARLAQPAASRWALHPYIPPAAPDPAAGASQHAAVEDTSSDVATALLRLNLQGPLALARAALPLMVQQRRGQHVVVASMSGGRRPLPQLLEVGRRQGCRRQGWVTGGSVGDPATQLRPSPAARCAGLPPRPGHPPPPAASALAAVVPSPGQAVYAAAKSGVRGYFASLSSELSDR